MVLAVVHVTHQLMHAITLCLGLALSSLINSSLMDRACFAYLWNHGLSTCTICCMITLKRPAHLMKQFSLLEIISTAVLLATVVVDLSRVFHAVDSATLQVTHRCTPAPHGMLAVPAALPTHSFGDMDHLVIQIFALYVRCRLVP